MLKEYDDDGNEIVNDDDDKLIVGDMKVLLAKSRANRDVFNPYGDDRYWDEIYEAQGRLRNEEGHKYDHTFDCLADFGTVKQIIDPYVDKRRHKSRILVLGCGNSKVGEMLWALPSRPKVTCVDFSPVVIAQMRKRHLDKAGLEYLTMDARVMLTIRDRAYDLIVDKALLDSVFCSPNGVVDAETCLAEIARVLDHAGHFVMYSTAQMPARLHFLQKKKYEWKARYSPHSLGYVFTCRKTENSQMGHMVSAAMGGKKFRALLKKHRADKQFKAEMIEERRHVLEDFLAKRLEKKESLRVESIKDY